jgi:ankyrin repeat protein
VLTDNSDVEEELQVKPTRLRMRNQCRVSKNEKGETGLHRACIAGKIDQVGKLLDSVRNETKSH